MLSAKNLSSHQGKLSDKYVGPFIVKEVQPNGVNVTLDLPDEYRRLHPVFHVSKLKRFQPSDVEWPGREQQDRPPPVWVDGEEEWVVEKIIGKREEVEEVWMTEEGRPVSQQEEESTAEKEEEEEKEQPSVVRRSARLQGAGRSAPATQRRAPPRRSKARKVKQTVVKYLVKWVGYDEKEAQWKRQDDLHHCQELVDEYEFRQLEDKGENSVALR
jgi:hypothetical protein